MKSNEMPNISNTVFIRYSKILYTAMFIRLFSILNTDLLRSVTSIPYNSAGRQKDLTNVTETIMFGANYLENGWRWHSVTIEL